MLCLSWPCTRTLALNSKAPKEVLDLFSDPVEKLKEVFKIVNFQETQKSGLFGKQIQSLNRQKKMFGELESRRQKTGSMDAQVKASFSRLVKQEEALREELNRLTLGNRPTPSGEVRRPGGSSQQMSGPARFEGLGNLGVGKGQSEENVLKQHNKSRGSSQGSGGGGRSRFLQMKTPAAWQHYQHVARDKVLSPAMKQLEEMRRRPPAEPAPRSNFFTPPPPAGSSGSRGKPRR